MATKDKWRLRIYKDYSEAARAFRSYFLKYPYNEEALDIALKKDYCSRFLNEVENKLINLNTNQDAYFNKVYYETICPLILHFKAAEQLYQGDRNEPIFIKFNNCYLHGLGLLAEEIRILALQKGLELKLPREIKPQDYILGTTKYIPSIEKGKKADLQKKEGPTSLSEIFKHPERETIYLKILTELDPPLLTEDTTRYIGDRFKKSVVAVWLDELERKRVVEMPSDVKLCASLLNKRIKDLEMTKDGSLFRKTSQRAEQFRTEIRTLISRISQGGNAGNQESY